MHRITIIGATIIAVLAVTATAEARTSCSDARFTSQLVASINKGSHALRLAKQRRYSAALVPARQALRVIKASAEPCDSDYWLMRRYQIKESVAIQRWLEERRDGNWDAADLYWVDVKFWNNEINDLLLEK